MGIQSFLIYGFPFTAKNTIFLYISKDVFKNIQPNFLYSFEYAILAMTIQKKKKLNINQQFSHLLRTAINSNNNNKNS